ncbi:MAG: hypothetical protein JOZ96_28200 [Acidobacteria bacterium]|nr:hypothetical protein [Acidobacteriota bacterium]
MQQPTHTTATQRPAGPLDGAGPYDYDLPAARAGAQPVPVPAPRPKWKRASFKLADAIAILFISFSVPWLKGATGWRLITCYAFLYAGYTFLTYWTRPDPKPKEGFVRWALKMLGLWLNGYFALVTVPEALDGLLPEWLAFALPAFLLTYALYYVTPVRRDTGLKWPLWQWLVLAAWVAVAWAWLGPSFIGFTG